MAAAAGQRRVPRPGKRYTSGVLEEALRLQRQREASARREQLTRLQGELRRQEQLREAEQRQKQAQLQRQLEQERRRTEIAEIRARQAAQARAGQGYTSFTPPQSFLAGGAASRISGAPSLLDVLVAAGAAAASTAWVITRDHSTGGDVGWSAFLLALGIVLGVEGHAEAHSAGVGLLGSQSGYLTARLLGGTVQPGL